MGFATYATSSEKNGHGTFYFTDCGHRLFDISRGPEAYHGYLCPGCLCKGIQTTLYMRGSEEAKKILNERMSKGENINEGLVNAVKSLETLE